ncbi:septum formation initiator family protein [uncultured Brachyspira sp.]|uniref:septum formation initiator family protein n=1 Tax=uncultured Brachyspira sp. TaxID=221953 RepID=UPI0025E6D5D7|nr:septum formation initiator family protein [uncultured Brachyspira sp.]
MIMQFNIRLRAEIFYSIVVIGLMLMIFLFVFSSKGFVNIDKQKQAIEKKKARIEELDRKKKKILNNIDRLTNDREYILSYAKTFGYLDSSKNEKIVKILRDNNKDSYSVYSSEEYIENDNEMAVINSKGVIILAIFLAISFIIYVLFVNRHIFIKKHSSSNVVNCKSS